MEGTGIMMIDKILNWTMNGPRGNDLMMPPPYGDDDSQWFDPDSLLGGQNWEGAADWNQGSTAPVYNYWMNQLPPDVLNELYGIFTDVVSYGGSGSWGEQLAAGGWYNPFYGADGYYNNPGDASTFGGGAGNPMYEGMPAGWQMWSQTGPVGGWNPNEGHHQQVIDWAISQGYEGDLTAGAGQEAADAFYNWTQNNELFDNATVNWGDDNTTDISSQAYVVYNMLMGVPEFQSNSEGIGFNFAPWVDIMSGSSIGQGLSEVGDLVTPLTPQTSLTPELIKQTRGSYYRPWLEASRDELGAGLHSTLEGTVGTRGASYVGKGLQNYGGRRRAEEDAWSQYYAGFGKALGNIEQNRAQARGRLGDIIAQWRQALSSA